MSKVLEAAAVRLRAAPLLLTMLALITGILGMHVLAGEYGTGDHDPMTGHSAAVAQSGGGSPALSRMATVNSQDHRSVERAGSSLLLQLGGSEIGPGVQTILSPHPECHERCPEMIVLNCVLALTLLGLAVLPRHTFYLHLAVPRISVDALRLLHKSVVPTGLSPVQLSISRT